MNTDLAFTYIGYFIVPFVFIYNPSLSLVVGFDFIPFIWVILRLCLAIWLITTALGGIDRTLLPMWSRILRSALGIGVLLNLTEVQVGAAVAGLTLLFVEYRWTKTHRPRL